ncbi:MAG: metal-dependent hydrolase [candidate division SR1 bacterium]|nr:metal-dependent hydrolase [candidate division SR1 bacterium]
MTGPTHLAAGLIIGHLTGDYVTAIACSVLIDIDHLVPVIKDGFLFHPKKLWNVMVNPKVIRNPKTGKKEDERNYLHSIFTFIVLSAIVLLINVPVGIVFAIAYAVHLTFDMLDKSDYYPFYPIKSVNIQGYIRYCSKGEFLFASGLFIIRLMLVFFNIRF